MPKRKARKPVGDTIGGGYVVHRRNPKQENRLFSFPIPYEHPDKSSAIRESVRLAKIHPEYVFEVFVSLRVLKAGETQVTE